MSTPEIVSLAVIAVCLTTTLVLSAGEAAIAVAARTRFTAKGDPRAALVQTLLQSRERLTQSIFIARNLSMAAASALLAALFLSWFGIVGIVYVTIAVTALALLFSRVLPKTIASYRPDRVALVTAKPVSIAVRLFGRVTPALEQAVRELFRLVGIKAREKAAHANGHEELRGAVDLLHREGSVVKSDRDMFGGLLDLQELEVSDVMVHRTSMVAIHADDAPEKIVADVLAAPYTRLPLWRGTPENIVGVLHAKNLLRALAAAEGDVTKVDIGSLALQPWFVPESRPLPDQLRAFLRRKTHFALVVDEYGEVMGLVTLEDILEEIVGDIADEHDVTVSGVRLQADGSVSVDGGVPIRDLNRAMDWILPDDEATTIAGLVIHEARSIPEAGQTFTFHGYRFQVLRKNRNRITTLRVTPLARKDAPTRPPH
ncbi:MAG TPA: HlyC/CorC family transporter [Xanthobacteraceae bacterium]|nr:HlyC/CorC family transporter [Xanthobacteraceae bacterium]